MATLAEMLLVSGNIQNAEHIARLLCNDDSKYLLDLQLILSVQGKIQEAWEVSCKAIKLYPDDHRVAFNRGWLEMHHGNLLEGFTLLEQGRVVSLYGKPHIQSSKPIWNGKVDIAGKTILFHCECGLGDEIIFVRFVKMLINKGAKVIIGCSTDLMSVFNRIEGVSAVVNKETDVGVYHDYWMPSMSSVKLLHLTEISGNPYLTPDNNYVKKWANIIYDNGKLKVGIRWAGNTRYEEELWRTVPYAELLEAVNLPNIQLYSLQKESTINLPANVIDLQNKLITWEDTIAAMKCLDLIITSCTSIPHMAGAIGAKTWVIVPMLNYYTWAMPGNKTPWYNSATLFRQQTFQDWIVPLKKIKQALKEIIGYTGAPN